MGKQTRRKRNKLPLPPAGVAFAVPLADGRFGVCRVLRPNMAEELKRHGADCRLVAVSAWIGDRVPDVRDPALHSVLHLTHHAWKNQPEMLWVSDPPPEDFIPFGTIDPSPEEQSQECYASGGWESCRIQSLAQWRWDHDREAVLAEDTLKKSAKELQAAQAQQACRDYLSSVTLEDLRGRTFFPDWKGSPSRKAIQVSRRIMADTVQQLIELGRAAPESVRLAVLRRCIESFNDLDAKMKHFITTIEREDICQEFEALVHACGLGAHEDLADEWRDW